VKLDLGEPDADGIDLAPLIDCVFLLLIFFMVTTTFGRPSQTRDDGVLELLLALPVATAATHVAPSDADLVIGLDSEGDAYLGGRLVDPAALNARLETLANENPNAHVRIEADSTATHQQLVHVLDLCQFVGLWNVGLRTR
jgi:biopolymer transport protein ExbD